MNSPDRAVRFGETIDKGLEPQPCFPFMYNFVNFEDDTWEQAKGAGTAGNLTGIGPLVGPLATIQHIIKLEPDYMFLLEHLKYTAYYHDSRVSQYLWYEPIVGWFLDVADYQTQIGTPLVSAISISLSIRPDNRYIYGGQNLDAVTNLQGSVLPLPVPDAQGYDYGYGQIVTPYLLPRDTQLLVEITNRHPTRALYVGGFLYGYKIRL